jgi:hypothetical protein
MEAQITFKGRRGEEAVVSMKIWVKGGVCRASRGGREGEKVREGGGDTCR